MNHDQCTIASMSDESLAELGLIRTQAEAFDRLIAQQKQEAQEMSAFLDAMRDSE